MRAPAKLRTGWFLLLTLASAVSIPSLPAARAEGPSPTPAAIPRDQLQAIDGDPVATMTRGMTFESRKNWSAAVQVYRDADHKWPSRTEFRQRLRLSEMHLRLTRRYGDQSFRNILLRLPREKAFELFDELVERIESHYVDAVSLERGVTRGYDNLEVALRDPSFAFLAINAPNAAPAKVAWLREQLRARRDRLAVADRASARAEVLAATALAFVSPYATIAICAACAIYYSLPVASRAGDDGKSDASIA